MAVSHSLLIRDKYAVVVDLAHNYQHIRLVLRPCRLQACKAGAGAVTLLTGQLSARLQAARHQQVVTKNSHAAQMDCQVGQRLLFSTAYRRLPRLPCGPPGGYGTSGACGAPRSQTPCEKDASGPMTGGGTDNGRRTMGIRRQLRRFPECAA